jgi:hypothetical protein
MILGNDGQPVWLRLLQNEDMDVMNFKAQTYKGETVLTWWEGLHTGYGQGEYVILDNSYRELARFGAGNGYQGDHHEFLITPEDTALITIYNRLPRDLVSEGDPSDRYVLDGIAQELDIETGEVLFEWHSLEHVGLDESYTNHFDYFHINSIGVQDQPQDGRGRMATRREEKRLRDGSWYQNHLPARRPSPQRRYYHHFR